MSGIMWFFLTLQTKCKLHILVSSNSKWVARLWAESHIYHNLLPTKKWVQNKLMVDLIWIWFTFVSRHICDFDTLKQSTYQRRRNAAKVKFNHFKCNHCSTALSPKYEQEEKALQSAQTEPAPFKYSSWSDIHTPRFSPQPESRSKSSISRSKKNL